MCYESLWLYHENTMMFLLKNWPTLTHWWAVKLWYTACTRMSHRVEHQHTLPFYIHACPWNSLAPPIPTVFPPSCAYATNTANTISYTAMSPTKLMKILPYWNYFQLFLRNNAQYQIHYLNLDDRISPQCIAECTFCLKCRTELLKLAWY